MQVDEADIKRAYDRMVDYCLTHPVPDQLLHQSQAYQGGLWQGYMALLNLIATDYGSRTVVDMGCKYGLTLPLFLAAGAKEAIGVEVVDEYIAEGRKMFAEVYPDSVRIVESVQGFIPLQPASADIVFINEVISHVNPMFLENVLSEVGRIVKDDGAVLVSDGNNLRCPGYFEQNLVPFYEAYENGPDGTKTDRDTVERCFVNLRADIISGRYPNMDEDKIRYLATNTSGLFGDFFMQTIEKYVSEGELVERPYRKGVCPTNPTKGGAVIERGFYPEEVRMGLGRYGFECSRVTVKPVEPAGKDRNIINALRSAHNRLRSYRQLISRHEDQGFIILGIKRY